MGIVVIDARRTPVAKSCPNTGIFRRVRADTLSGVLLGELWSGFRGTDRAPSAVIWGCARQHAEQGFNIARQAALEGGLPIKLSAMSVNRNCSSGLDAILVGAGRIATGQDDAVIAGGVEQMDHLPLDIHQPGPRFLLEHGPEAMRMGMCAEHLAVVRGISRQRQDDWAHRSHQRAATATTRGDFRDETVPVAGHGADGLALLLEKDNTIRHDSDPVKLAGLKPLFRPDGTVTAGNTSQVNAAAAAVVLMREEQALAEGIRPLARLVSWADTGIAPLEMGLGPVPAARKALGRAGLSVADIDQWEINEAFAAQVIAVTDDLGLDEAKVNPRGGAIALGHPLGATGARLAVSLCRAISRGECGRGVVALCVGGGQGVAAVFERV